MIKCKDCAYCMIVGNENYCMNSHHNSNYTVTAEDFCSWASSTLTDKNLYISKENKDV